MPAPTYGCADWRVPDAHDTGGPPVGPGELRRRGGPWHHHVLGLTLSMFNSTLVRGGSDDDDRLAIKPLGGLIRAGLAPQDAAEAVTEACPVIVERGPRSGYGRPAIARFVSCGPDH